MARTDCRKADVWASCLEAGDLEDSQRIRLQDHLDNCPSCRQRDAGVSRLVTLLREEQVQLREARKRMIWQQVNAANGKRRTPLQAPYKVRSPLLALAAAAAVAALVLGSTLLAPSWLSRNIPPSQASVEKMPLPAWSSRWEVRAANHTMRRGGSEVFPGATFRHGEGLDVAEEGRAMLVSPTEVMVVGAGTSLALAEGRPGVTRVKLGKGRISILTSQASRAARQPQRGMAQRTEEPVEVAVKDLLVRPVGTLFSVATTVDGIPEITVVEGRVDVLSPRRTVRLTAPSRLVWGEEPVLLSGQAGERITALFDRSKGDSGSGKDRQAASSPTPAGDAPGAEPPASNAGDDKGPGSGKTQAPRAHRNLGPELLAIERLLARGSADAARARAESLMKLPGARDRDVGSNLLNLISEAFLRQGKYRQAKDAYLDTWRQFPGSNYGADALYNAATIELDQLGEPALAGERLQEYLKRYRNGRQREGAFYLLHRALTRQGEAQEAAKVLERYRGEFPMGQYSRTFK